MSSSVGLVSWLYDASGNPRSYKVETGTQQNIKIGTENPYTNTVWSIYRIKQVKCIKCLHIPPALQISQLCSTWQSVCQVCIKKPSSGASGWWTHWTAGRIVYPERAWQPPAPYLVLCISPLRLFLKCILYNKLEIGAGSWTFWREVLGLIPTRCPCITISSSSATHSRCSIWLEK